MVVASSDATHAELVIAAVRAGKPVLCEKPLGANALPSASGCGRARRRRPKGSPLISLGFMRRYDPGYQQLRREVAGGAVGRPCWCTASVAASLQPPGATHRIERDGFGHP